jgi:hypothetical protein
VSRPKPATLIARSRSNCKRRRFLNPKQQTTTARVDTGKSGLELRRKAAVLGAVAMTVSIVQPFPITILGEKTHVASVGSPEQRNETVPLNPFTGVTYSEIEALFPVVMVSGGSVAGTEKSDGLVMVADATALLK